MKIKDKKCLALGKCSKMIVIAQKWSLLLLQLAKEIANGKQVFRTMKRKPSNTLRLYRIPLRQDSKKLGKFPASGVGKVRQTAEHTGCAIYNQLQRSPGWKASGAWHWAKLVPALTPRLAFPPLTYRWPLVLEPLIFHMAGHMT